MPLSASLTLTGLILTTFCEVGEVSLFPFSGKENRAQKPERNLLAQWAVGLGFKLWTSGFRVWAVSQVYSSVMSCGFFSLHFLLSRQADICVMVHLSFHVTQKSQGHSLTLVHSWPCCTSWAGHGLWWHEELCGAAETSGSPRENRPQKAHVTKTICPPLQLVLSCYKKRCYNCPISPPPAMHSSLRMEASENSVGSLHWFPHMASSLLWQPF